MSALTSVDPLWIVADLVERSRRLATVSGGALRAERVRCDVALQAEELQRRCSIACESMPRMPRRHRTQAAVAIERLAVAVDDLAAVALLRVADARSGREPATVDVHGLLDRVGERHDLVVGSLRRAGIRRTATSP